MGYGLVTCWGWLVGGRGQGLLLLSGSLLLVAWLAGIRMQGTLFLHSGFIGAMALVGGQVSRRLRGERQQHLLLAERLEESHHQLRTDVTRLDHALTGLRRRVERYRALQAFAQHLTQTVELPEVCRLIVEQSVAMVGKSHEALLFLVDRDSQRLALTASQRAHGVPPIAAKQGDAFDQLVLRTRKGLLVDDVAREPQYDPRTFEGRTVHAVLTAPLIVDRGVEGLVRLDSADVGAYTQDDLRLLGIIADLGSTAITAARLYAQTQALAMTDGLTGLLVRRAFLEGLQHELRRAQRQGETRALLMVDIDYFKRYNDTLGHTAGDLVLQGVARILRTCAGPEGLVARYGGEEFAILLSPAAPAEAVCQSEQIRAALEREPFILRREPTHVTVSIGLAHYPDEGQEPIELLRLADARLYRAKQAGRNRLWST